MADPQLLHRWNGVAWGCCPECRAATWHCPGCGAEQQRIIPPGEVLPITGLVACDQCGCLGSVTVLGWQPAAQLASAFRLPDALRPAPVRARPKPKPQAPDPADAPRRALGGWTGEWPGLAGVAPSAVARAFAEVFGQPPHRHRSGRLYSRSELARVMAHLGHGNSSTAKPEAQR